MNSTHRRLARLEQRHGTAAPTIDRIIITAPGGSPDAVVMQRQANGEWTHTKIEGSTHE